MSKQDTVKEVEILLKNKNVKFEWNGWYMKIFRDRERREEIRGREKN